MKKYRVLSALLLLIWPVTLVAQENNAAQTNSSVQVSALAQDNSGQDSRLEEIVVVGERTLRGVRFQLERAQEDVYRLFNQLLDDTEYKIQCNSSNTTSSHIVRRSCEPAFLANQRARYAAQTLGAMRSGEDPSAPPGLQMEMALAAGRVTDDDIKFDLAPKYDQMNLEMFDLAMENPELAQALLRFAAAQTEYQALLERREAAREDEKGRGLFCGLFGRCNDD